MDLRLSEEGNRSGRLAFKGMCCERKGRDE